MPHEFIISFWKRNAVVEIAMELSRTLHFVAKRFFVKLWSVRNVSV